MPRGVRKVVRVLAYFGLPVPVGLACSYFLSRSDKRKLSRLEKRVRAVEQRVEDAIMDAETENAAHALGEAAETYSAIQGKPFMRLVKRSVGEG